MRTCFWLTLTSFTLLMWSVCSCKKDSIVDLHKDTGDTLNTDSLIADSLDSVKLVKKQLLKACLDNVSGYYLVTQYNVDYCLPCPPPDNYQETMYPDAYYLLLSNVSDSLLGVVITGSASGNQPPTYFFSPVIDCCPPINENFQYDPDIVFGISTGTPHNTKVVRLFENQSVSMEFTSGGMGGGSSTTYSGNKVQ